MKRRKVKRGTCKLGCWLGRKEACCLLNYSGRHRLLRSKGLGWVSVAETANELVTQTSREDPALLCAKWSYATCKRLNAYQSHREAHLLQAAVLVKAFGETLESIGRATVCVVEQHGQSHGGRS